MLTKTEKADKADKKGTIRFSIKRSGSTKSVQLAGDFNAWKPVQMRKGQNGVFAMDVPLRPGTYQYRFIIDGQWLADPDNAISVPNPYGGTNSVAQM